MITLFRDNLPLSPQFVVTYGENRINPDDKINRYVYSIKNNHLQDPPIEDNFFNNIEKPVNTFPDGFNFGSEGQQTFNSLPQPLEQLECPYFETHFNSTGLVQADGPSFEQSSTHVHSARVTNRSMNNLETFPAAHKDLQEYDFRSCSNDDEDANRPSSADIFFGLSDSNSLCEEALSHQIESLQEENAVLVNPLALQDKAIQYENEPSLNCAGVTNDFDELEKCLDDAFKYASQHKLENTQDVVFNEIENSSVIATNLMTGPSSKSFEFDMPVVNHALKMVPQDKANSRSERRSQRNEASAYKTMIREESKNSHFGLTEMGTKTDPTENLSTGATNFKSGRVMSRCVLNLDNLETEFSKFLHFSNINQRFKIRYKGNMSRNMSFKDFSYGELKELVSCGSICIEKLPLNSKKVEKYASVVKEKKTSIVSCKSILHGLALSEKWGEIKETPDLEQKTKSNKFSNYQRADRTAGEKLTKEYLKNYGLSHFSSREEIEEKCCVSIAIFNCRGNLEYFSPKYCKKVVYFLEDNEKIFFVKNLSGFCRIN